MWALNQPLVARDARAACIERRPIPITVASRVS